TLFLQRDRVDALAAVGLRMIALQLFGKAVEARARLLDRDARPQAADGVKDGGVAGRVRLLQPHRPPQLRRRNVDRREAFRHHADHLMALAVDRDGAADDAWIAAEAALPQAVAEHDHARGVRHVVFLAEPASERRPRAGDVEVVVGRLLAEQRLRHLSPGEAGAPAPDAGQALEDVLLCFPVELLRRAGPFGGGAAARTQVLPDDDQA